MKKGLGGREANPRAVIPGRRAAAGTGTHSHKLLVSHADPYERLAVRVIDRVIAVG
jgi:hypothetical protein